MLSETFQAIGMAARRVVKNWPVVILAALVYALLLVAVYSFLIVREASVAQVVFTFFLAIAAPILFFLLQSIVANAVRDRDAELRLTDVLKRSLFSLWKLILITLPVIALGVLLAYLLTKAQNYIGPGAGPEFVPPTRAGATARTSIDWRTAIVSGVRYLIFGLVLPLIAIHLWLATARDGLVGALRGVFKHLGRAFAPQSVLIYVAGFLVFGVIPYFLLFRATPSSRAWLDLGLLVTRLVVIFALTLLGWMITIRALSLSQNTAVVAADEVA